MPTIIVNVAVIHENQILLTQRDDFVVWCLPGGGVEEGESVAQAAIRETKEETGLDVELKSLVGIYSLTGALPNSHAVLLRQRPPAEYSKPSQARQSMCVFSLSMSSLRIYRLSSRNVLKTQ